MICSKKDYLAYLEADKIALGRIRWGLYAWLFDDIWYFERLLRKMEYYCNCKKFFIYQIYLLFLKMLFYRKSRQLGFTIPLNVFGPGLSIAHIGTIVVNSNAKVGANCRLHVCTSIGTSAGCYDKAPILGDNIYIGPGAKLFGDINIANNIAIGANSVVNKSFLEQDITIAGNPAMEISKKGTKDLFKSGRISG